MAHFNMEVDKMLDVYIYDYLVRRKCSNSARIFHTEADISARPSAIDAPGGFLFEWWSIFWDISRYWQPGHNNEDQIRKALEQLQQQKLQQSSQQQLLQQMQMQVSLQKHFEQQNQQWQRKEIHLRPSSANNDLASQSLGIANDSTKKIYEEGLIPLIQKDILAEAEMKKYLQTRGSYVCQLSDATHTSVLRSATSREQPPMQLLQNSTVGNLRYIDPVKDQKQQFLASQSLTNPTANIRSANSDGSLIGFTGSNQAVNNFPLEGWPLMDLDQLQPGPPQPEKLSTQPPQRFQLHPQMRLLLNDQNIDGKYISQGDQPIFVRNAVSNILAVQLALPILPHGDKEMQPKVFEHQMLKSNECHEQVAEHMQLGQQLESHNYKTQELEKMSVAGSTPVDAALSNTYGDYNQADVDYFETNRSLLENIESFSSSSDLETKNAADIQCLDANQDVTLLGIGTIYANKVHHCDLSSDGKLIATNGDDKKIVLWCMDSREQKCILEEHINIVTDLRFGPKLPRLATSSLDSTVKVWNVDNPSKSVRTFSGHATSVMSLDFHPKKEDLICSCDDANAIRYWSIKNGDCTGVSKGGATQVRFQPVHGKYLAAAVQKSVSLIDVETAQVCRYPLKGHARDVLSVSWDLSGEYLASLSKDLIRVWKIRSGGEQDCVNELSITGKKFHCCVFHPRYPSVLVIGFNQSLELWHMTENKMMAVLGQPTNALSLSRLAGLVASANDENLIKIWK